MFSSKTAIAASMAILLVVSPSVASAQDAFKAVPPHIGVYGCMNQDAMEMPALQFGLLTPGTYSTFDGGRGNYTYSPTAGMLTFTSGPFAGLKRSRETERTFRIVDEQGVLTSFLCPWEPKDPTKVHW
jgi:hypothetical protein